MSQHTRNVLQVTWRRCYNIPGTSCKLLEEDVTTYQERLASYLAKILQHTRNLLQANWRRWYNIPGTSCKLIEEDVTTYDISGTSCKLFEEAFTTYHEHLTSYTWNKMWQGSRIVLHVTWRSYSNVSRIRNALQLTWRRRYNASRIRNVLQVTFRRCYNVGSGVGRFVPDPIPYPFQIQNTHGYRKES